MGPLREPDRLGRRLAWAALASLLVNLALWSAASSLVRRHVLTASVPVEITRIILPRTEAPKPLPRKPLPRRVAPPRRVVPPRLVIPPRPFPRPKPTEKPRPQVTPKLLPRPPQVARPPRPRPVLMPSPPAPHHNIMTAHGPAPKPQEFALPPDGQAPVGVLIAHQGPSNVAVTPPQEVRPDPKPPPASEVHQDPQPRSEPSGPTREAEPANQVQPEIPDDLRQESFKSFVRVRVIIEADGSFTVVLRTSSGNAEVDRIALDALKRWKWKPALENGKPVQSTQFFRYEFEVD